MFVFMHVTPDNREATWQTKDSYFDTNSHKNDELQDNLRNPRTVHDLLHCTTNHSGSIDLLFAMYILRCKEPAWRLTNDSMKHF